MSETQPEVTAPESDSHAAFEAFYTSFGGSVPDWPPIGLEGGYRAWEAAARAVADRVITACQWCGDDAERCPDCGTPLTALHHDPRCILPCGACERENVAAGPDSASVPSGELAAFGNLMEKTQGVLASLRTRLDAEVAAERARADKAEAELAALGNRIDIVIAVKAAAERERAERAEAALSDALLRLAHGDAELHARLLADAGYDGLPDCGGRETEGDSS